MYPKIQYIRKFIFTKKIATVSRVETYFLINSEICNNLKVPGALNHNEIYVPTIRLVG